MSVSAVSSNDPYLSSTQNVSQSQQDLNTLGNALNAGDLTTAQSAFASFQSDLQNIGLGSTSSSSTAQSGPSQDMQNLQSALSAGNLPAAKSAYAQLVTDLQNQKTQPHHHHHHGSGEGASGTTSTDSSDNGIDLTADNTTNTVNVTA